MPVRAARSEAGTAVALLVPFSFTGELNSVPMTTDRERRPACPPLIIAGPTGVGKSQLGLALAQRLDGEIIVADSMQIYRGLDIGTNKPSPAERAAVPHHLVDICEPDETFSAFAFAEAAHALVGAIQGRGRVPIVVGGTGLYLRAFLKGQLSGAGRDAAIRDRLRAEADRLGVAALYARLCALDQRSAGTIRSGDLFRIIRALELIEISGAPASAIRPDLWDAPRVPLSGFVVLAREREELASRIADRATAMWEAGLLEEARRLLATGLAPDLRPLQAIGYRQAVAVLSGGLSLADAQQDLVRATRQYAKRQLTWFRREPAAEWMWVSGDDWVEPLADQVSLRCAGGEARLTAGGRP